MHSLCNVGLNSRVGFLVGWMIGLVWVGLGWKLQLALGCGIGGSEE